MNHIEVLPCPVDECEFAVGIDEDTAREEMEQHVRWLHLREHDFGENPMPALTAMLINGLLRPKEFAEEIQRITDEAFKETAVPPPPGGKRLAFTAAGTTVAALLMLWTYDDLLMRGMVTLVLVVFCAAIITYTALVRSRW